MEKRQQVSDEDLQFRKEDEFIKALEKQIQKRDLKNLLSTEQRKEIYEFSKEIIESIVYDFRLKNSPHEVIVDYLKINQIINKYSPLLTLPESKTILDYCYLVLKEDVLQSIISEKNNQAIIIEELNKLNKKRIEGRGY